MYFFKYINDHIIADINGRQCLIDSGAPNSLGDGEIGIGGKTHILSGNSFFGVTLESISEEVGTHLDALVGGDILSTHDGLFVWTEKKEIYFTNKLHSEEIPLEVFMNVPIVQISIHGQCVKAFVDTGAKQSYIDASISENLQRDGTVSDFYPGIGKFDVPTVTTDYTELQSGHQVTLKFGILPEQLSPLLAMADCKAILGVDWLRNNGKSHFQINYLDKKFSNY